MIRVLILLLLAGSYTKAVGQTDFVQRCAADEVLQLKFTRDPSLKKTFDQQRSDFLRTVRLSGQQAITADIVYTVPVVFHIVLTNPDIVTDAMILAQLDTINSAFSGKYKSTAIGEWFSNLFGQSSIQFCLAQRTPEGLPSTGIHRVSTSRSSFSVESESVKYTAQGGTNIWDNTSYMNIWITQLSGGILGYSSFPNDGAIAEQGVVIDYRSLPGGNSTAYDEGKTLVHEAGHFFNLYHIWGDDNGSCNGSDDVDDTPNQANSTTVCANGKSFDRCTNSGNGIMYQNYMDYTPDECLLMFTTEQALRMETAFNTYYSSFSNSIACQPVNLPDRDAAIVALLQPAQRLCDPQLTPVVRIKNLGSENITQLNIISTLSTGEIKTTAWTGNLKYYDSVEIKLTSFTLNNGNYILSVSTDQPNEQVDNNLMNDTISASVMYYTAANEMDERPRINTTLPQGWDILGLDLRLRELNIMNVDSAYLAFDLSNHYPVELLLSQDCGSAWSSLVNTSSSDTINLTDYIGKGNFLLAFRSLGIETGVVYPDRVQLITVTVNPNLKAKQFMITPNPATNVVAVQFYPEPDNLKGIILRTMMGQQLAAISVTGRASAVYTFDISRYPSGIYLVSAIFADRQIHQRLIKR